jgi:1-acyl-sn-glycerol-3-phosphate acyltransferase
MRIWYRFCRFLFRLYFWIYHRGRVYGAKNLPDRGAFILAGNHISFLDPPFFGLACKREAFYMARDTLFHNPISNWILRSWNCVPITRDRGDIGAMRTLLRMLGEGKAVLMFPEGTRSQDGKLQEARAGIGMVVARAHVPILPMRIFGTERALPRGASVPRPARVTIVFGEPFTYPFPADFEKMRGEPLKALYPDIAREIMRRIEALQPS